MRRVVFAVLAAALCIAPAYGAPSITLLTGGLQGGSGSTIGPGGALYVTESAVGQVTRIDPQTGERATIASGLPPSIVGIGGAIDLAFIGRTPYVLVTLVGPDVGGRDVVGIYRVDAPNRFTVIADIGEFALANPPSTQFDVPTGLQYAIETWRGGFLVADGHHNRVLRVTLDGDISVFAAFDNVVPTGLAVSGNTVYMAEAGPVPHLPRDGRIVALHPGSSIVEQVASGGRLLVDVEFGRGRTLFALSQGVFPAGDPPGAPALANTGALLEANEQGGFNLIVGGLNLPTSLEFVGDTAFVVTLTGQVWRIDGVSDPPYGVRQR